MNCNYCKNCAHEVDRDISELVKNPAYKFFYIPYECENCVDGNNYTSLESDNTYVKYSQD
jgi:hypothetical protein